MISLHPLVPPFLSLSLPFSTQHSHSFFLVNIRLWVYEYIYRQVLPCLCVTSVLCSTWHITGVEMVEGRKEQDIINFWFTSSPQSILAFTPPSNSQSSNHELLSGLLLDLHLHSLCASPSLCHCY